MQLRVNSHVIDTPIITIINEAKKLTDSDIFKDIEGDTDSEDVIVTCPFHKNGKEQHPSCHILNRQDTSLEYGIVHCFTCGHVDSLPTFLSRSLNISINTINNWLIKNFSSHQISQFNLPEIDLDIKPEHVTTYLKHEDLKKYNNYHPYMFKRGLSKEVIDKFFIGYDKTSNMITFPVWDENNNLLGVTKRSVTSKYFHIPVNLDKPIYLLNYILNEGIKTVHVCESQINALTLWTWGIPAIALFGTGSSLQYDILRKYSDLNFVLCFDGDDAGKKGAARFVKELGQSHFIVIKEIPQGKDVNDLSFEEFKNLKIS